jgi:predicted DNA-binding ArsR family transcriptional regulator
MFKDMRQIVEEATPQLDAVEEKVSGTKAATEEGTVTLMQVSRSFTIPSLRRTSLC